MTKKKWGNQLVQCLSLKVQPSTLVTLLHQAGLGRSKSLIPQGRLPLPLPSLPSTLLSNLYLLIDILYSIISYSITYFPLKVHSCFVLIHGSSREKYTFVVLQLCLHPLHPLGPWFLVCQFIEISNQIEVNGHISNFEQKKLYNTLFI